MDDVKARIRARPSEATLAWVCEAVGARSRIDSWMVAPGGSACAIHAIDVIDSRGVRHPLILKRFFRADWVAREPDVAEREARHLELLEAAALPIARLVAFDRDGDSTDLPAVLMTRLAGRSLLLPDDVDTWLREIAECLQVLHALPDEHAREFPPYRHYTEPEDVAAPPWTKRPDVWERVIARLQEPAPPAASGFVHRDYHPCNLLWQQGELSGVLDFTDSSYGPRGVDLAHCRFNLAQLHGPDAADRFADQYGSPLDPYWDCVGFLNCLPGPHGVYWGWVNLGVRNLTEEICHERLDEHAARVVARLG